MAESGDNVSRRDKGKVRESVPALGEEDWLDEDHAVEHVLGARMTTGDSTAIVATEIMTLWARCGREARDAAHGVWRWVTAVMYACPQFKVYFAQNSLGEPAPARKSNVHPAFMAYYHLENTDTGETGDLHGLVVLLALWFTAEPLVMQTLISAAQGALDLHDLKMADMALEDPTICPSCGVYRLEFSKGDLYHGAASNMSRRVMIHDAGSKKTSLALKAAYARSGKPRKVVLFSSARLGLALATVTSMSLALAIECLSIVLWRAHEPPGLNTRISQGQLNYPSLPVECWLAVYQSASEYARKSRRSFPPVGDKEFWSTEFLFCFPQELQSKVTGKTVFNVVRRFSQIASKHPDLNLPKLPATAYPSGLPTGKCW